MLVFFYHRIRCVNTNQYVSVCNLFENQDVLSSKAKVYSENPIVYLK